jgi:hypothetical protein
MGHERNPARTAAQAPDVTWERKAFRPCRPPRRYRTPLALAQPQSAKVARCGSRQATFFPLIGHFLSGGAARWTVRRSAPTVRRWRNRLAQLVFRRRRARQAAGQLSALVHYHVHPF